VFVILELGRQDAAVTRERTAKGVGASPRALADRLRVGPGFVLADVRPRSTPGFSGGKADAAKALAAGARRLGDLQERLFAEGRTGGHRSLLLVVQGMDTSGKGGIVRHVVGAADPQGVHHHAFAAPTEEELAHHFLWRVRRALPAPGQIGVFDRSHYEDVVVARVRGLVPREVWQRRYAEITKFERSLTEQGTTVVKVLLQISLAEQHERLAKRLARPDKHWKFDPADIDERLRWPDYQQAYQDVLDRCSTVEEPWYVVPADRKWYARWAVQQLLLDALERLDPQWPAARFDVAVQRARLAAAAT
jgi:PPK2 family polyphosphate:nucleotide phosphotransferase